MLLRTFWKLESTTEEDPPDFLSNGGPLLLFGMLEVFIFLRGNLKQIRNQI